MFVMFVMFAKSAARIVVAIVVALTLLAACGSGDDAVSGQPGQRATLISVAEAERRTVEITERTVGRIASQTAPVLTAEVTGRVIRVLVDAGDSVATGDLLLELDAEPYELAVATARTEIGRLNVMLRNRERELARNADLLRQGAINQATYDAIEADVEGLREQLEGAEVRRRIAERDLGLARVTAPVPGTIDERFVSTGDFVRPGEQLFRLIGDGLLRVRLPFPETLADRIAIGQTVRLQRPGGAAVKGVIDELRPALIQGSRTLEAMIDLENPGDWRPGGSVAATVVVDGRTGIVVPTRSVVQRPAGEVVYVIENGHVSARSVTVGSRGPNVTEIIAGLDAGEVVAMDGAGFLTDGAAIRIAGADGARDGRGSDR